MAHARAAEPLKRFGGVIGGSNLREMLSLEEQKAAMGCGAMLFSRAGGALGVPLMLSEPGDLCRQLHP